MMHELTKHSVWEAWASQQTEWLDENKDLKWGWSAIFGRRPSDSGSVQKVGVSRRLQQWRRGGRDRLKQVAETRSKRTVVDRTPNLQQQVGAPSRPSHLLRLVHPPVDQEVSGALSHRRSDAQACTVSFGIIDEPSALATEIVIDLAQRVPQLAGWHTRSAMTALALEDMHDLADALECTSGIPGLAVPDPPVQSLDLGDDRRLCLDPTGLVGGQSCTPESA